MLPSDAATRVSAERPPPETATFSAEYLLPHAAAEQLVVVARDRLAQLPQPGDRRVLLIACEDRQLGDPRRRAGQRLGLGHALTEVAPVVDGAASSRGCVASVVT